MPKSTTKEEAETDFGITTVDEADAASAQEEHNARRASNLVLRLGDLYMSPEATMAVLKLKREMDEQGVGNDEQYRRLEGLEGRLRREGDAEVERRVAGRDEQAGREFDKLEDERKKGEK